MQNAPAMLAQKMMNRQAPYGPIGMVSQNMSGNKKGVAAGGGGGGGGVIGLVFDVATATSAAGVEFTNSNTTITNNSGFLVVGSKSLYPKTSGNWYVEFTIGTSTAQLVGIMPSSFAPDTSTKVGYLTNSVGYQTNTGSIYQNGGGLVTTVSASTIGDVIGIAYSAAGGNPVIVFYKNNVVLYTYTGSGWTAGIGYVPAWTSNSGSPASVTISNNIYSAPATYTPLGSSVTTISASASVPAVADGAYDVYTFNASGTFTVASTGAVRALVIAGGGGNGSSGGGGAGGYQEKAIVTTPQTYTITVGGGGTGAARGSNSIFSGVTSSAGGGGSGTLYSGGGSGEGGSATFSAGGDIRAGGVGTVGQGRNGGQGYAEDSGFYGGGGGGGAVGAGQDFQAADVGGAGGTGATSSITGTAVARGGGGGGAGLSLNGTATAGGGIRTVNSGNATANTGGGAAGGSSGLGGSGVVIIRVRARA